VRLEGLSDLQKNLISGIEPATLWLVAWCLNQLCYHVALSIQKALVKGRTKKIGGQDAYEGTVRSHSMREMRSLRCRIIQKFSHRNRLALFQNFSHKARLCSYFLCRTASNSHPKAESPGLSSPLLQPPLISLPRWFATVSPSVLLRTSQLLTSQIKL
jgi:hypothetical protein